MIQNVICLGQKEVKRVYASWSVESSQETFLWKPFEFESFNIDWNTYRQTIRQIKQYNKVHSYESQDFSYALYVNILIFIVGLKRCMMSILSYVSLVPNQENMDWHDNRNKPFPQWNNAFWILKLLCEV